MGYMKRIGNKNKIGRKYHCFFFSIAIENLHDDTTDSSDQDVKNDKTIDAKQ